MKLAIRRFRSGDMPFSESVFAGHYYTGNSIAAAENTLFFQTDEKCI